MSKFDEVLAKCEEQLKAAGGAASLEQLRAIAKGLGPSIYNRDSSTVSGTDESELETVRKNFIEKKLGVLDGTKAKEAIDYAIEKMGSANRNKLRPVFYSLVAEKLDKLKNFG